MRRPYRVLATLSALFNILGVIALIAGIVLGVYFIYTGLSAGDLPLTTVLVNAAIFLVVGVLTGLVLLAAGQLLRLLIDVATSTRQTEINTRATAKLVQRQLSETRAQASMSRTAVPDLDDNPLSFLG